jgi:hypothetical protein
LVLAGGGTAWASAIAGPNASAHANHANTKRLTAFICSRYAP